MIPAPQLVSRRQSVGRIGVRRIAKFGEAKAVAVEAKCRAVAVSYLRVAVTRRRWITIIDRTDHGELVGGIPSGANERRCQGIIRTAGREIGGRESGEPEARIQKQPTAAGSHP